MQSLEQQLYDVYGVDYIPWWRTTPFYLLCSLVLGIVLVSIIYYCVRRYRAAYHRQTPWDKAVRTLNAVDKNYLHADHSRLFYYTITDTIKTYLHERYGYRIIDKTDEECIAFLATTDFPPELQGMVQTLLRAGTMSKFALERVTESQMREHSALARTLITSTIPQRTT